ncbi:hypothetical protein BK004_02485 [bacterium CG10_46_32]|nr:MAG: hypothetical protein BK004_02485 [bacterium CG10_46_32]
MPQQDSQFLNPDQIIKQINLSAGAQVADLGCGTGYMSFAASHAVGAKGRVYAVDVQKAVLEQVKKEAQVEGITNIITMWSDLEVIGATKIATMSLDAVLLVNILFLLKDKSAVFSEAKRALKKEGTLLVVDWLPGNTAIGPPASSRVSKDTVMGLASGVGFVQEKEINAGSYHFGLVFKQQ